jgi:SAM-dependent methyltransferase
MDNDLKAMLYDAQHTSYQEDLPYWRTLASRSPGPILELGCGTGRVYIPLLQDGYEMWGLDNDPAMLAILRTRLENQRLPATNIFLTDMSDFQISSWFSLMISPCNTFSTLTQEQRISALNCILAHLQPGGCFAASLPNPVVLAEIEDQEQAELESIFIHPLTGNPVQVSSTFRRRQMRFQLDWHYDHMLPDGQVERHSLRVEHEICSVETYLYEFQTAGLQIQKLLGDFAGTPWNADSPELILEAVKPIR